jgi:LPS-assembly protein
VGDFHLNAPEAPTALQSTQTTPVLNATSNYNQLRFSASYGASTKAGLSAGTSIGYDFVQNQLQYGAGQAAYNWDCCGLSFEVRRYSLGTVRDDTQYLYSFTLAGVGSAGSLRRAARIF